MKSYLILLLAYFNLLSVVIFAQTLTPVVVGTETAGGLTQLSNLSVSYSIGQPFSESISASNTMLTEGFQQSYFKTLNLKAFIEGYYVGSGLMRPVLRNQLVSTATIDQTDSVTVELYDDDNALLESKNMLLKTNGSASGRFSLYEPGQPYWIALKHRNGIQTWSGAPVTFSTITNYDFSSNQAQAYGDNLANPNGEGIWALCSADFNQDENVDLLDFPDLDFGVKNGLVGYQATDTNGDGNVDLLDFPVFHANLVKGRYSHHP